MNTEAFVYRWRHRDGMWYIGYHKGNPNDGYICSSVTARPAIEQDPDNWTRKILRSGSKLDMMVLERRLLKKLNAKDNSKSYNRSNGYPGIPTADLKPLDIQITGWTHQTYSIPKEFEQAFQQVSGKSYYAQLLENFFGAVRERDRHLVKKYIPMIEKIFGPRMELI